MEICLAAVGQGAGGIAVGGHSQFAVLIKFYDSNTSAESDDG
jgi:hypothetical protein